MSLAGRIRELLAMLPTPSYYIEYRDRGFHTATASIHSTGQPITVEQQRDLESERSLSYLRTHYDYDSLEFVGHAASLMRHYLFEALNELDPECVVDSCGDPAGYVGAYRLGDRKIILHFCEQHFDETNDQRLDFAPDSSDVRAALWHQVAETLAAALTRHGSSFDALRAYEEAKALDV